MALTTLRPDQIEAYKQMLEELGRSMTFPFLSNGGSTSAIWSSARRSGKSAVLAAIDEYAWSKSSFNFDPDLVTTFKTEGFEAAEVKIYRQELDSHDPRHPNPKGGKIDEYVIKVGDRTSQPIRHLPAAKLKAKAMHDRMIEQLKDVRQKAEAERQLQELEEVASFPINTF